MRQVAAEKESQRSRGVFRTKYLSTIPNDMYEIISLILEILGYRWGLEGFLHHPLIVVSTVVLPTLESSSLQNKKRMNKR